jgi:hypothetical protein
MIAMRKALYPYGAPLYQPPRLFGLVGTLRALSAKVRSATETSPAATQSA